MVPLGALLVLRRRLPLDALLLEERVEVDVGEAPAVLGDERGPVGPNLDLLDVELARLLGDARLGGVLLGVPDLLPAVVLGDVWRLPRVDVGNDLAERADVAD